MVVRRRCCPSLWLGLELRLGCWLHDASRSFCHLWVFSLLSRDLVSIDVFLLLFLHFQALQRRSWFPSYYTTTRAWRGHLRAQHIPMRQAPSRLSPPILTRLADLERAARAPQHCAFIAQVALGTLRRVHKDACEDGGR